MSAVVCRKRSTSIFDELQYSHTSASKRIRCSSGAASPPLCPAAGCLSPSRNVSISFTGDRNIEQLNHLRSLFPDMDQHYLERALEASDNDLDSAIKSLNDLCLEAAANKGDSGEANAKILSEGNPTCCLEIHLLQEIQPVGNKLFRGTKSIYSEGSENTFASGEESAATNIPKDGSEWVELFVREMMNASNIDDARARASRALEVLEKSIIARVNVEAKQSFVKESMILKEQVEVLLRENTILKSAVAIQHGRQKDYDEKNHELQHLKQLILQYQEQLSKLEVNNYALAMHLRQAQQGGSIPGKFHPDIF